MGCRGLGHEIGSEGSIRAGGLAFLALGQISSRFWGAGPPKSALLDTLPHLSLRWRNEWSPAATYAEVANIRRRGAHCVPRRGCRHVQHDAQEKSEPVGGGRNLRRPPRQTETVSMGTGLSRGAAGYLTTAA